MGRAYHCISNIRNHDFLENQNLNVIKCIYFYLTAQLK